MKEQENIETDFRGTEIKNSTHPGKC